jgi:peptide-methionine (R)-S-oxide reductase
VTDRMEMTDAEWREQLSEEEYEVLRKQGTERAFAGKYWDEKAGGTYRCKGCGEPVFSSDTKFDSGSGWPSFYEPVEGSAVETETDHSHGMTRTEVHCGKCGGHLGHRFPDGPQPSGQRYCINSCSLDLHQSGSDSADTSSEAVSASSDQD